MDDTFKIGQLTKELVAKRLQEQPDPPAIAAGLVRETLAVAAKAKPEEIETVVADACYGALQGVLLAEQDLARTAGLCLEAVAEVALACGSDPAAVMNAGIRGIVRMKKLLVEVQLEAIRKEIAERFDGAGPAFDAALERESAPSSRAAV